MTFSFGKIEKLLLFGTGSALVDIAEEVRDRLEVGVVTGPRLLETSINEKGTILREYLDGAGLPWESVTEIRQSKLVNASPLGRTLGLSFGAPWIFREDLIARFEGRLINGHGAALPRNRGGGGFSWQILTGDRVGYAAYHLVTPTLDEGAIVRMRDYIFPPECKRPIDFERVADREMSKLGREIVRDITSNVTFELQPQPAHLSTYWPRLNTDIHGFIDWDWMASDIEAFVDAFDRPYRGASTFCAGKRIRLRQVGRGASEGSFHPFQAGIIYRKLNGRLYVAARGGNLIFEDVRWEDGSSAIDAVRVGDRFYTPQRWLDAARETRVAYNAVGLAGEPIGTSG